jgi:hypothetical protein
MKLMTLRNCDVLDGKPVVCSGAIRFEQIADGWGGVIHCEAGDAPLFSVREYTVRNETTKEPRAFIITATLASSGGMVKFRGVGAMPEGKDF